MFTWEHFVSLGLMLHKSEILNSRFCVSVHLFSVLVILQPYFFFSEIPQLLSESLNLFTISKITEFEYNERLQLDLNTVCP